MCGTNGALLCHCALQAFMWPQRDTGREDPAEDAGFADKTDAVRVQWRLRRWICAVCATDSAFSRVSFSASSTSAYFARTSAACFSSSVCADMPKYTRCAFPSLSTPAIFRLRCILSLRLCRIRSLCFCGVALLSHRRASNSTRFPSDAAVCCVSGVSVCGDMPCSRNRVQHLLMAVHPRQRRKKRCSTAREACSVECEYSMQHSQAQMEEKAVELLQERQVVLERHSEKKKMWKKKKKRRRRMIMMRDCMCLGYISLLRIRK